MVTVLVIFQANGQTLLYDWIKMAVSLFFSKIRIIA